MFRIWGGEEVTKGSYSLAALQLNIQVLSSSVDNLRQIVSGGQPNVVGLCKTFLDSDNEMVLDIHGYPNSISKLFNNFKIFNNLII